MGHLKKEVQGDQWIVQVDGRLDHQCTGDLGPIFEEARAGGAGRLTLDLSGVEGFEARGVVGLLDSIGEQKRQGLAIKLRSPQKRLQNYLSLVDLDRLVEPPEPPPKDSFLERVGKSSIPFLESFKVEVAIIGETLYWLATGWFRKEGIRWDRVGKEIVLVGVNAIPIVLLISILMGMILAMQAAAQLRQFGADIFIADLVGVSITRELGPIMTAIIVAGRSGSANAAEIGTMVVSEEIDAIRQMGINPRRFLFVPKIVALVIGLPCLGVLADFFGIGAGALFATSTLDIGWNAYLEETRLAIMPQDLYTGLFKCGVFGLIIGATGCAHGMIVKGGAGEVGRAATAAVVASIFYIISSDAFFTWAFQIL